jgi:nicotinate-nucleotide adenylyltransferase
MMGAGAGAGGATTPDLRSRPRIGIFGGTFDPPHIGHLVTAADVRYRLALDRMLLVVANDPWQKRGGRALSPADDRLALVAAAVEGVEGLEASDIEIRRGGPSYTADTLVELRASCPGCEAFVVLGSDAAAGLPTWERVEEVRDHATIVVVDRPGSPPWAGLGGFTSVVVEVPRLDVSSTDVRRRVAEGRPIDFLVPAAVASLLARSSIYGGRG